MNNIKNSHNHVINADYFEEDPKVLKQKLKKKARAESQHKYYLRQKNMWKKFERETDKRLLKKENELKIKDYVDQQERISKELDNVIRKNTNN